MVLSFVVAFFLFGHADLVAQHYPNLVSESQAEAMLGNEIPVLENAMNGLSHNSPAYELAKRTYLLYMHTWEGVVSGITVEDALTSAYNEFAVDASGNEVSEDELPQISKNGADYGDQAFDSLVNFLTE